jgi:hypothetical protein
MLNPPSPNHDCSLETSGNHTCFVMQKVDSGSHPAVDESNEWSAALHLEGARECETCGDAERLSEPGGDHEGHSCHSSDSLNWAGW